MLLGPLACSLINRSTQEQTRAPECSEQNPFCPCTGGEQHGWMINRTGQSVGPRQRRLCSSKEAAQSLLEIPQDVNWSKAILGARNVERGGLNLFGQGLAPDLFGYPTRFSGIWLGTWPLHTYCFASGLVAPQLTSITEWACSNLPFVYACISCFL
jgi:hypothetical protein